MKELSQEELLALPRGSIVEVQFKRGDIPSVRLEVQGLNKDGWVIMQNIDDSTKKPQAWEGGSFNLVYRLVSRAEALPAIKKVKRA